MLGDQPHVVSEAGQAALHQVLDQRVRLPCLTQREYLPPGTLSPSRNLINGFTSHGSPNFLRIRVRWSEFPFTLSRTRAFQIVTAIPNPCRTVLWGVVESTCTSNGWAKSMIVSEIFWVENRAMTWKKETAEASSEFTSSPGTTRR